MFKEGQRVYIRGVQKYAYIVEKINDTSYAVIIDEMEYSAHITDIQALENPTVEITKKVDRSKFEDFEPEIVEVLFEEHRNSEDMIDRFDVYVKSTFATPVFIHFQTQIERKGALKLSRIFTPKELTFAFSLTFDDIDEKPTLNLEVSDHATKKNIFQPQIAKLRPQLFFKGGSTYPKLKGIVHKVVFQEIETPKTNAEILVEKKLPVEKNNSERLNLKANFKVELDLHAEALNLNTESKLPFEICNEQFEIAKLHIRTAYELSENKVILIHGIGNGSLRRLIHDFATNSSIVASFKNEYHPKYGFGSTEVEIQLT